MNGWEYQKAAQRTANQAISDVEKLINGVMGLCGEAGECIDLVKKMLYQGHDKRETMDKLAEELGDVMWYAAETAEAIGVTLDRVMLENIAKLEARYPGGFDPERSRNREEEKNEPPKGVTLCKDCMYCYEIKNTDPRTPYSGQGDGSFYCLSNDMDLYAPHYRAEKYYCADARRREG